ncbi:MAG: response regulator transcription factor [Bacteroidetes bacterium]|nr:response regulator transcription factor [Bacteroidota bacterium]
MKNELTKIYIADDHQIIIDGLQLLLRNSPHIFVVGSSNDGQKAFDEILSLEPDIAILDIKMPELTGLQVLKQLRGKTKTRFIMLTMFDEPVYVNEAIHEGAHGYLLKDSGKDELLSVIESTMNNKKTIKHFQEKNEDKPSLSPREKEILKLLCKGYNNPAIAKVLLVSEFTVATHRKNLMRKTGIKTAAGLIDFANSNLIK